MAGNICQALPRGPSPRLGNHSPPSSVTSPTSKIPRTSKSSGRELKMYYSFSHFKGLQGYYMDVSGQYW